MDLLHDTSTETFSDVLVESQEQFWRINQPGNGIHAAVRVALGQEVVKEQGDLVILDHLWSLYELFRYKAAPILVEAEATRLTSLGPFEHVHSLMRLYRLLREEHFSTRFPQCIPTFSTRSCFRLHSMSGCCMLQAARRS